MTNRSAPPVPGGALPSFFDSEVSVRIERFATLIVLLAALGFVFVLVPAGTEAVTYGAMSPDTLPRVLGWIVVALAIVQLVNPFERRSDQIPDPVSLMRALFAMGFVALCTAAIPYAGFLPASMVLGAGACLILRERRWLVIAAASLVMPPVIWALVTMALDRPLP